jgi:hypothetical protein
MARTLGLIAMVLVAACGEDPPSCQQAVTHYYQSGCTFIGTSGTATSQQEAFSVCVQINTSVPDECRGEFEDWLECIHETPGSVTTNAQCDCTQESDALFACG